MSFRVAVVGAGRMGKLHARVLGEMEATELVCVVDSNAAAAQAVADERGCDALSDVRDAVDRVDAAIIAVPTVAHVDAGRPFIEAGKSVLIEKPITNDVPAGEALIALARETGASLQVGHTERFNPVAVALRKYDVRPKFIEADRISPFTFRSADVGVVLDMMIHDIDLILNLAGGAVERIDAVGVNVMGPHEDICNARILFDNGCVANVTASRLAIKTERKMRIFSEQAYLSLDYGRNMGIAVKKSENLDILKMAREMHVTDLADLAGKVDFTELVNIEQLVIDESSEPLRRQAEAFRATVMEGSAPVVPADEALAAVKVAYRIVAALKAHRWDGNDSQRTGLGIIDERT